MFYHGINVSIKTIGNERIEEQPETRLLYIMDGSLLVSVNNREILLQNKDIMVLNTGESCYIKKKQEGIVCWIDVANYVFDELLYTPKLFFLLDSTRCEDKSYRELQTLLNHFILDYAQNGGSFNFSQFSILFEILNILSKNYLADSDGEFKDKEVRIQKIISYIHQNYDKPISLTDLADALYLSNVHLSRIFKQNIGIGFREYLNKVRLNHAKEDLVQTDKSVIRIANDNGFSSVAAFNKLFKEEFKELPSFYRKQMQKQNLPQKEVQKKLQKNAGSDIEWYHTISENLRQEMVLSFKADTSQTQPYSRPWMDMINVGTAVDLLNYKILQHYTQLASVLKFTYARFWGLFSDGMMLLPQNGGSGLNFNKLDEAISSLLKNRLKPYIQFGPIGRDLYGKNNVLLICEANPQIMAYSAAQWGKLVEEIIDHFIRIYEKEEVETWIFELCSSNPWDGTDRNWFTPEHFSFFYKAIKQRLPGALAGGCVFIEEWHNPQLPGFVQYWKEAGTIPDFISYMAVPYSLANKDKNALWLSNADYLLELTARTKARMQELGIGDRKLFFSFYNMTTSNINILNDSVYKGAWIIKTALSSINQVDAMCYWTCSDAYAEYYDNSQFLFGGSGLIGISGHLKPAYYAFCFLKKLRSSLVQLNENCVITTNSHGNYAIVYHNLRKINGLAHLKPDYEMTYGDLQKLHDESEAVKMTFTLTNMPEGRYYIRIQHVNQYSGSVLDEWQRVGGYSAIPEEDKAYINQISIPHRSMIAKSTVDGCLEIEINAESNEFGLIELFSH